MAARPSTELLCEGETPISKVVVRRSARLAALRGEPHSSDARQHARKLTHPQALHAAAGMASAQLPPPDAAQCGDTECEPLHVDGTTSKSFALHIHASAQLREELAPALVPTPRRARRSLTARSAAALKRAWEESLLSVNDIPDWMRDNDRILSQYRPQLSVAQAVRSLFSWHNETFNCWSHICGLVIFLTLLVHWLLLPSADTANPAPPPKWPLALYLASCCYVYACSACAHLFYVVGRQVNDIVWKLDHSAIAVNCTCGFVPICITAFSCSGATGLVYIGITFVLAAGVMCASMVDAFHADRFRVLRAAVQLSFPAWAVVPFVHAVRELLPHPQAFAGLQLVGAAICTMVAGALVFASRLTETLLPGRFDVIGSSHNIMHTSVVIAHLLYWEGAKLLWDWRGSSDGMC